MAVLPIRLFPDPILRTVCKSVIAIKSSHQKFLSDLIETLYAQRGGIGIAAPQAGEPIRLALVDVSSKDPAKRREIFLNPLILRSEGQVLSREGCMSLPDYTANVYRAERLVLEWTDEKGRFKQRAVSGIEAICIQHEIDHLNGVLFIDRVASLKTDIFPRKKPCAQYFT